MERLNSHRRNILEIKLSCIEKKPPGKKALLFINFDRANNYAFRSLKSSFFTSLNKTLILTFKSRSGTVARWRCCFAPKQVGLTEILNQFSVVMNLGAKILPPSRTSIKGSFWCSNSDLDSADFQN